MAPGLVISPYHEPVARIRIAQQLIGDRDIVLHFARNSQPARWRDRSRHRARSWTARSDASDGNFRGCRHGAVTGQRAVRIQDEGRQVDVSFLAQAADLAWGHGLFDVGHQSASAARAPGAHEVGSRKLRRFGASPEVRQVAAGTLRLIDRAASGRLLGIERPRYRPLRFQYPGQCQNRCC